MKRRILPARPRPASRTTPVARVAVPAEVEATDPPAAAPIKRSVRKSATGEPVEVKVTTVRMPKPLYQKLELLQGILRVPVNRLINDAIGDYAERRAAEVEVDMTQVLERIRAARRSDPHHVDAIAAFVQAEAAHGNGDPVEGVVRSAEPAGPAQARIRSLLSAS